MSTLLAIICLVLVEVLVAFIIWVETVMSWARRLRSRVRSMIGGGRAA